MEFAKKNPRNSNKKNPKSEKGKRRRFRISLTESAKSSPHRIRIRNGKRPNRPQNIQRATDDEPSVVGDDVGLRKKNEKKKRIKQVNVVVLTLADRVRSPSRSSADCGRSNARPTGGDFDRWAAIFVATVPLFYFFTFLRPIDSRMPKKKQGHQESHFGRIFIHDRCYSNVLLFYLAFALEYLDIHHCLTVDSHLDFFLNLQLSRSI